LAKASLGSQMATMATLQQKCEKPEVASKR
jgi:hypothetical protein